MPKIKLEKVNSVFGKGTVNTVESSKIDRGASSGSSNFITYLDRIELTRGRRRIGAQESGSNPVLGLHVAMKSEGEEVMFRKIGTKLQVLKNSDETWHDIKTGLIDGEALHFDNSFTPAGRQVWACGPDGLFKLYPASYPDWLPYTTVLDMTDENKNYKGNIKIEKSAMYCWGTKEDPTGLRRSCIDKDSNYHSSMGVSFELSASDVDIDGDILNTGNSSGDIPTYSVINIVYVSNPGTLPGGLALNTPYYATRMDDSHIKLSTSYANAKAGTFIDITSIGTGQFKITVQRSLGGDGLTAYNGTLVNGKDELGNHPNGQVFGIVITDGTQILKDDKNGNFIGDGIGYINYATGQLMIQFKNATTSAVIYSHLFEDPKVGGLADFTYSNPRLAGEGNIQRQDASGSISRQAVTYGNILYTLQDKGSFRVSVDLTDTSWDNLIYNSQIGIPSNRSAVPVDDGIILINTFDSSKPKLSKLSYNSLSDKLEPIDLSLNFKMEDYVYDEQTVMIKFGDFVVFSCKSLYSEVNDVTILYNTINKTFDVLKNGYNYFAKMDDKLYGGDSSSPNVYELFSGYDDLDFDIEGEWNGKSDNLDTEQLKKVKQIAIEGYISVSQKLGVYASYDGDSPELLGVISGTDTCVERGQAITVGSVLIGSQLIGGERTPEVYHFKKYLKIRTPKFARIMPRFVPLGIGYLAITEFKHSDIRLKGSKTLPKYK